MYNFCYGRSLPPQTSGTQRALPGAVASIQTFGEKINLHPHLHLLVIEGGEEVGGVEKLNGVRS